MGNRQIFQHLLILFCYEFCAAYQHLLPQTRFAYFYKLFTQKNVFHILLMIQLTPNIFASEMFQVNCIITNTSYSFGLHILKVRFAQTCSADVAMLEFITPNNNASFCKICLFPTNNCDKIIFVLFIVYLIFVLI